MQKKIEKIAIKTPSGKIKTASIGKSHNDLHTQGKRGFVSSGREFMNRKEGAKVANKAHQTSGVKSLHSHNLKNQRSKSK